MQYQKRKKSECETNPDFKKLAHRNCHPEPFDMLRINSARPGILMKIPLEEKRRLLFLQHFVVTTNGSDEIYVIFTGATILQGIAPLLPTATGTIVYQGTGSPMHTVGL